MEKEEKLTMQDNAEEQLFVQIKQMLDEARRQIARTVNSTTLNLGEEAHHLEYKIHRVLEILLHLARYLVVGVREERLQAFHETVQIGRAHV